MPDKQVSEQARLRNAKTCRETLGTLLSDSTSYLRWLANSCLDPRIRHRVSEQDVVQETFANAIRSFADFRGETPSEFSAWLRQILLNCVARQTEHHLLTARRDARREVSLQLLQRKTDESTLAMAKLFTAPNVSPDLSLELHDQIRQLIQIIDQIPSEQRKCILLRHRDGLRFREIGRRLNCTESAARMRYTRALQNIRQLLQRHE